MQCPHETDRHARSRCRGTRTHEGSTPAAPAPPCCADLTSRGSARPASGAPVCGTLGPTPTPALGPDPSGRADDSDPSAPAPTTELGWGVLAVAGALGPCPPRTLLALPPPRGTRERGEGGRHPSPSRGSKRVPEHRPEGPLGARGGTEAEEKAHRALPRPAQPPSVQPPPPLAAEQDCRLSAAPWWRPGGLQLSTGAAQASGLSREGGQRSRPHAREH